jgi:hypothetical protein
MNAHIVARLALTLLVLVLIIAVSIVPGQARPGDSAFIWLVAATPTPLQKALHCAAYALLALLWMWTLENVTSQSIRIAVVLALTIGTGAVLEWYQTMVPGRFGTLIDVILNASGTVLGVIAAVILL